MTGRKLPWQQFARLASQTGFPGVDVALDEAMAEGVEPTRALLRSLRLKPACIGFPLVFQKDDAAFRTSLAALPDAAQFAAAIDCPRMTTYILPSSILPKAEQRRVYLDRFKAAADVLARSHVRLAIEYISPVHLRKLHPNEFIWRMDEMLEFTRDCGSNVGLLVDSWHWHHAGATPADIVRAGKDRIVHVQINDSAQLAPEEVRDNERLMPGEGVINLAGFLAALKEIGYNDAVSVEVFGRGLKDMPPEAGAKLGYRTGLAAMEKAGLA
ncbi:MAG: sugar phosphate isomerase/epimerase [Acidobacteriota bacterium]|nr:sugar phosphate isomerase/epimerase [Acidobacteriota bacterium]